MRAKHLWINLSIWSQLRIVWNRITVGRLTIGYFLFSVIHCLLQTGLQSRVFVLNHETAHSLAHILALTNSSMEGYPLIGQDLRLCHSDESEAGCFTIWDGTPQTNFLLKDANAAEKAQLTSGRLDGSASLQTISRTWTQMGDGTISTIPRIATPTTTSALSRTPSSAPPLPPSGQNTVLTGRALANRANGYFNVSLPDGQALLSEACTRSLNYPAFKLERTEREDAALILFNLWVLGMSVVAILNESIPHIIASSLTHVLSTAWSGFQVAHTAHFALEFNSTVTRGACSGVPSFLSTYWSIRRQHEIPAVVFNVVSLAISLVLTFRLIKTFGWKTYKRVGASLKINRLYKLVLVFSIALQLSLFFIAITVGVWVDQLFNGAAKYLADHRAVYATVGIVTILLIGPWVWLGWTGSRLEQRTRMIVFLVLSVLYIAAWLLQLFSHTFRWQFLDWPFFTTIVVFSLVLTLMTAGLGLIVRLNFGKGLLNYLNKTDELPEGHFIQVNIDTTKDVEIGKGSFRRSFDSENDEKVALPEVQPGLMHHTSDAPAFPVPAMIAQRQPVELDSTRKLPSALKGVARYQGLERF